MSKLIAELGINHNASYKTLLALSDMALEAGFDYIKIQCRTPEICVPKSEWNKPRQWFDGTWTTYIEYKQRLELDDDELSAWFTRYTGRAFASVWDLPSLARVTKYNPPFIKIPSALLTNSPLISMAIDTDIPIILSTGMSTIEEIDVAVKLFPKHYPLYLMHCTSAYPVKNEEINLNVIRTLQERYGLPVGYSSHDKSPYSSLYAMVLGAWGIEVHSTLDRTMMGTDHGASLEKPALHLISRERERIPTILGDGYKQLYDSELESKRKLRGET